MRTFWLLDFDFAKSSAAWKKEEQKNNFSSRWRQLNVGSQEAQILWMEMFFYMGKTEEKKRKAYLLKFEINSFLNLQLNNLPFLNGLPEVQGHMCSLTSPTKIAFAWSFASLLDFWILEQQ